MPRNITLGRRLGRTLPGGLAESFGYDASGNQICQTNFNGLILTNQYDVMNRLLCCGSLNGAYTARYAYNTTNGWRTNMVDASGVTVYQYDVVGELINKWVLFTNGPVLGLGYSYSPNGSLTGLWSGSASGVNNLYEYDLLGRLTNVVANGSPAAGYAYDAVGNLQAVACANGVTNLYRYDALNRLTNLVWKAGNNPLASFAYTLGPTGNRTALAESVNGTSRNYQWTYDPLYRLTQEALSGGTVGTLNYAYDAVGNRTSRSPGACGLAAQTATFTATDGLVGDSYDPNGNTTGSAGNTYQYDALNHMTGLNNGTVVLAYNGDGQRVAKTVYGNPTYYLVDDRNPSGYAQVVEEWTPVNGTLNVNRVYNYGLGLISQRVAAPGNFSTNYFLSDGHGSTRLLTDTGGSVVNAFTYDAYGNVIASLAAAQTAYLYCGQQWDADLGLYYNRARYLNPNTGRFFSRDTDEGNNEDPLSLHKYLYCEANPVNGSDPAGQAMSWDSYFGYEAERTIEDEYEATHAGDGTMYGARQSTGTSFLKPDIFNPTKKKFLEIKPISGSGISKGLLKIGIDEAAFGKFTLGFSPDASWQPRSHLLETDEDGLIYVINVGGLVLYKDIDELKWQLIAVGSIKVASDLLPYLRLSMSDLSPLAARIRVLSLGIATEEEADIDDSVLLGGDTALMGAP